ncbi:MAG: M23 family metallopeptidase, partial [Prolixibacteraceae bacterium]|nr:M23 family metallopeptidase [Prolixibacteraceae bacterium]
GNQYKNSGDLPEDYYCFGKAVLAPADGIVAEIEDNIRDNSIGDINTKDNWGNTVVIKHEDYIYSKVSHLKFHSIKVKQGDNVKKGQLLGICGNTGRSPYPHLHFQFQAYPYVGSTTIDYPFGHYLLKEDPGYSLKSFDFPLKDQILANPLKNEVLDKALHFIPGRRIKVTADVESNMRKWKKQSGEFLWTVETDVYNNTNIYCKDNRGRAYLFNTGDLHYFTNFSGKKYSPLFWFYIMFYKVPLGFLPKSQISDFLPVHIVYNGFLKYLQDFVAPFFLFLKADYKLIIKEAGDILSSDTVEMEVQITKKIAGRLIKVCQSRLIVNKQGVFEIYIEFDKTKISMICRNELD